MADKIYAVIDQNGLVVNTAIWDEVTPWDPGDQYALMDVTGLGVGKGWTWDGNQFVAPPRPPPVDDDSVPPS